MEARIGSGKVKDVNGGEACEIESWHLPEIGSVKAGHGAAAGAVSEAADKASDDRVDSGDVKELDGSDVCEAESCHPPDRAEIGSDQFAVALRYGLAVDAISEAAVGA